jgi:ATP-dependent helicase/DNAse subunit B
MGVGFQKFYFSSDALALQKSFLTTLASQSKKDLRPVHVLVSNYYVAAHLRHLLAQGKSLLNVRFVTFRDLAKQNLHANEVFLSKLHLTPEMELFQIGILAKKVLRGTEQEIVSNKRGFHQNLRNLFHHLIGQGANKIPSINSKTKSFDQIFQQYLGLKKTFYNDPWLIEAACGGQSPSVPRILNIFGITKFSPLEMRWLNQLAQNAEVNLWMERTFFEDLQETIFTWAGETFADAEELSTESRTLLTVTPVAHLQDEATWMAQTIIGQQKTKANQFHRTGIFLNDFRKQKTYVEHTLTQYNIPYVVYGGQPLTSTRIGQAIEQLTELFFQNWKRDVWVRFLQTFPFKQSVIDKAGIPDQWNQWTIDAQVTDKNTFYFARLENLNLTEKDSKPSGFIEWQKELISSLETVEKTFTKHPSQFFQNLFEWIQTYADVNMIDDKHAIFFDEMIFFTKIIEAQRSPTGEDGRVQRSSQSEAGWLEVKPVILEKLSQPTIQDKVFESDGVFIAPISVLPGLTFDTIFLPHMNEGCFPKSNPQSFDVTSQEMFKITQSSGVSFPSAENEFNVQRVLFETTKTRASQVLISYAQFSLPGQEELRPSIFIHGIPKDPVFVSNVELPSIIPNDPAFTQSIQTYYNAFQSKTWSQYNALISNPATKKSYSSRDIQLYLSCPRQYYLSQVLRLSVEDYPEDQFQVNPLDKGNLVHEILFKTFSRLKSENLFPLEPKNKAKIVSVATEVAGECFDRFVLGHAYGSEELWRIDRDELLLDVTQYMKHEIKEGKFWVPYALEYRFGMGARSEDEDERSSDLPVSLPVLGKNLEFRGKVDRIDLSPDKKQMRIIDYKTGAFEHVNWNYKKGTNLQIPLYMLLSKHFFPELQPERVEGTLVHVKSFSKFDKRTLPHESLAAAEEKILELLDLANTGINEGKFYPNPGFGRSNCRLCDFQSFCGENIDRDIESIPVDEFMDTYKQRKEALK